MVPGRPDCDLELPYLAFSNRLFKGIPTCYPRLPVGYSSILVFVESRSALDQNTSWVIVEIPPEKILLEQIV